MQLIVFTCDNAAENDNIYEDENNWKNYPFNLVTHSFEGSQERATS